MMGITTTRNHSPHCMETTTSTARKNASSASSVPDDANPIAGINKTNTSITKQRTKEFLSPSRRRRVVAMSKSLSCEEMSEKKQQQPKLPLDIHGPVGFCHISCHSMDDKNTKTKNNTRGIKSRRRSSLQHYDLQTDGQKKENHNHHVEREDIELTKKSSRRRSSCDHTGSSHNHAKTKNNTRDMKSGRRSSLQHYDMQTDGEKKDHHNHHMGRDSYALTKKNTSRRASCDHTGSCHHIDNDQGAEATRRHSIGACSMANNVRKSGERRNASSRPSSSRRRRHRQSQNQQKLINREVVVSLSPKKSNKKTLSMNTTTTKVTKKMDETKKSNTNNKTLLGVAAAAATNTKDTDDATTLTTTGESTTNINTTTVASPSCSPTTSRKIKGFSSVELNEMEKELKSPTSILTNNNNCTTNDNNASCPSITCTPPNESLRFPGWKVRHPESIRQSVRLSLSAPSLSSPSSCNSNRMTTSNHNKKMNLTELVKNSRIPPPPA